MGTPEFKIEIYAPMELEYVEKDGCFYASMPHFNLVRDGKTEEEATTMLADAFQIMAKYRWETGTLETHLQELGFRSYRIWNMNDTERTMFYAPKRIDSLDETDQFSTLQSDQVSLLRQVVWGGGTSTGACQA
jgi:predicted RNase H-like HicB family nuclease